MTNLSLISEFRDYLLREIPQQAGSTDLRTKDLRQLITIFLNWRARLVPQVPRRLIHSREYEIRRQSHASVATLCHIERLIKDGGDLRPYLSTGIRHGYISDLKSDASDKDFLINDLRIHHLHLGCGRHPKLHGFVDRTIDLLFAIFTTDKAYLLDISDHSAWGKARFAKILLDNWPNSGFLLALEGILPGEEWGSEQRDKLRRNGIATAFDLNGIAYMGSGFISTAGYSRRVVHAASEIYRIVSCIEECAEHGDYSILQEIYAANRLTWPANEVCQFAFFPYHFGIVEDNAKIFLRLVELP